MLRYLAWGAVAGVGILGVGGRLVMTAFALIAGIPLGFSVRGSAAVALSGALYGLPGGLLCWAVDRRARIPFWPRAILSGIVVFLGVTAVALPSNQAGAALERPILSIALFLPLAIGFAAAVQRVGRPVSTASKPHQGGVGA